MSSNQQEQSDTSGDVKGVRGGGTGGKSLALMQQRLLPAGTPIKAAEPVTSDPIPAVQPSPTSGPQRPGKSAANLLAAQAKQLASTPAENPHPIVTQPQSVLPPVRPKGKDFSTMAKNAGSSPKAPTSAPAPATLAYQPTPNPMQHQGQIGPGGRPKGKDFASLANRMGGPPIGVTGPVIPIPVPPPIQDQNQAISAAQAARAAQMQAAARAAAGYTPNQRLQAANAPAPPPLTTTPPINVPPAAAAIAAEARHQHLANLKAQQSGGTPMTAATKKAASSTNNRLLSSSSTVSASSRPSIAGQRTSSLPSMPQPNPVLTPAFGPPSTKPSAQPSSWEAKMAHGPGSAHISPMVGQRLRDLVTSLDPNYTLDAEAEEQVLQLADDFLEKVTKQSMRLAQHRGSKTLDVPDIQLALAKQWGIVIPGLGVPSLRPSKPGNRVLTGSMSAIRLGSNTKRNTSADDAGVNEGTTKKVKVDGTAQQIMVTPATGN